MNSLSSPTKILIENQRERIDEKNNGKNNGKTILGFKLQVQHHSTVESSKENRSESRD